MIDFSILFEDGEALVIDKPAGLPLDPPRAGGDSLENHLDALRFGFQREPQPVHRLDQDTSGCLLLARNPKALKRFSAAFEAREVDKVYLGIVAGACGHLADVEWARLQLVERDHPDVGTAVRRGRSNGFGLF